MNVTELRLYRDLLGDIKSRVRQAQHRAALSANSEMIRLYWDIGRMIAVRQKREGWGSGVIPRLAVDLKNELPEQKGFSETNLKRMVQFSREYPDLFEIGAQPAPQMNLDNPASKIGAQPAPKTAKSSAPLTLIAANVMLGLPWFHHITLIQKLKELPIRQTKDRVVAEYALRDIHKPIGVADYELTRALPDELASSLPSIEDIEAEFAIDLGKGEPQ